MTWKWTSILRTFWVSRIQREVIQQKGHAGSNQKSARTRSEAAWPLPAPVVVMVEVTKSPECARSNDYRGIKLNRLAIKVKPKQPSTYSWSSVAEQRLQRSHELSCDLERTRLTDCVASG